MLVLLAGTSARGVLYGWNYAKDQPGLGTQYTRSDAGGTVESIAATFDTTSKRLTFDVLFSGANNTVSPLVTSGFWLVLNDGPSPHSHPGELAVMYFDASRVLAGTASSPTLTVYGYNGLNANTSWHDGNGDGLVDSGDLIKGSNETGFIFNAAAGPQILGGQTLRRMRFDIDATDIIAHTPLYPVAGTDWKGTGFAQHLGLWFHPVQTLDASYEAPGGGRRGRLTSLTTGGEGWLDGANFETFVIPSPASAPLLLVGLSLAAGRRRR